MLWTNLWIPPSCHICLTYKKKTGADLFRWYQVSPFYTIMKSGRLGHEKSNGHDWSLSKDRTGGKVGVGISGMQPDTG